MSDGQEDSAPQSSSRSPEAIPEPDAVHRRDFLDAALVVTTGGLAALGLVPVIRFATPPRNFAPGASRVRVGRREDFPEHTSRIAVLDGEPILVVALPGGTIRAFGARCTHLGCSVHYSDTTGSIDCPCHGGRFGLDGRVLAGPPPTPLREFAVEIHAGDVLVSKD